MSLASVWYYSLSDVGPHWSHKVLNKLKCENDLSHVLGRDPQRQPCCLLSIWGCQLICRWKSHTLLPARWEAKLDGKRRYNGIWKQRQWGKLSSILSYLYFVIKCETLQVYWSHIYLFKSQISWISNELFDSCGELKLKWVRKFSEFHVPRNISRTERNLLTFYLYIRTNQLFLYKIANFQAI